MTGGTEVAFSWSLVHEFLRRDDMSGIRCGPHCAHDLGDWLNRALGWRKQLVITPRAFLV